MLTGDKPSWNRPSSGCSLLLVDSPKVTHSRSTVCGLDRDFIGVEKQTPVAFRRGFRLPKWQFRTALPQGVDPAGSRETPYCLALQGPDGGMAQVLRSALRAETRRMTEGQIQMRLSGQWKRHTLRFLSTGDLAAAVGVTEAGFPLTGTSSGCHCLRRNCIARPEMNECPALVAAPRSRSAPVADGLRGLNR